MNATQTFLAHGLHHPYDGRVPADVAHRAAVGVLAVLGGRCGIGDELEQIDDEVKSEITDAVTAVIREAYGLHSSESLPKFDAFLTERLRLWKDEGVPAPRNELQAIQAWLRCLGEHGASDTAQRMRERMLLLMKTASTVHTAGADAEDAVGIYSEFSREALAASTSARGRKPVFYVASRASNPERPRMWTAMRDVHGFDINSTWIDAAAAGLEVDFVQLWDTISSEIAACDCLVLYVEPQDFPLKGAFVEVGRALGLGTPIRIVAPGIGLDTSDCKPLGSWAKHRLVSFHPTVLEALATAQSPLS